MSQNDKRVGAAQSVSVNQPEDDGATNKKAVRAETEVVGKVNATPDQIDKSGSADESAPQTSKPA